MTESVRGWTHGDRVSRALIDLAADRSPSGDLPARAGMIELAQRHGLIGALTGLVDDPLVRAIHARESARREVKEAHLRVILTELHEAGVRVMPLKGPEIASHYREPDIRNFSDLDLLVPSSELDSALEVIARSSAAAEVPPKRPRADKRDIIFRDASGVRFNVDLHWDLFSYSQLRGDANGATDAAWEMAEEWVDSPWGPMWRIPDAHRIAFLATHAVLDHRFRLILFRDFLELVREGVDWSEVAEVASRWGLRSTTYLALWITRHALDVPIPDDLLAAVRPASAPLRYLERALPRTDLVRFDGHRPHAVNLAAVLLNDSRANRFSLLVRAPSAFPHWRRRVAEDAGPDVPRTLIVVSTDLRRGAEVFTERLRDGLQARGWVVEAVSLRSAGLSPKADVESLTGETPKVRRFELDVIRSLRRKIRSFQPDLIIANGGATLRYGLAAKLGLRFSLAYISIGEPHYWIRSRLSRWANRLMLRWTDEVLTVSDATREQLVELEPSIAGRIHTTYTGVPPDLLKIPRSEADGPLRVLMIGSLTPEKDPELALRVVSAVEGAVFRLVGDGPLRDALAEEAEARGMTERVEFVGSVTDVTPHLEWAHVLLLTSLSEGLPGAILEAGAAAVPTVAVDVGGVGEAVVDGETGFVTSRDEHDLVEALARLAADRVLLDSMGEAAREHIAGRFLLDPVIDTYAEILHRFSR